MFPADVAVIAGDLVPATNYFHGSRGWPRQVEWLRDQFVPWLNRLPVRHVVFTYGNHDWCADLKLIPDSIWPKNVHPLVNSGITIEGVHFYGVPQTPRFFDWAFNEDDNEDSLGLRWRAVDPQTDVLISHGPPFGCVDAVGTLRVGSVTLRRWLEYSEEFPRPRYIICGHIHPGGGNEGIVGTTTVYNVAILNDQYNPVRSARVIEV
jgi:Icc-related predicted phosphoesterase